MTFQLIGRDSELVRLAELADRAANGTGCLVLMGGEAGAGKTALARAAIDSSALERIEVAATETPGLPYAPITAVLRAGVRKGYLKPGDRSPLRMLLPELGAPRAEEGWDEQLMREVIGMALGEIAVSRPFGLVVDDCQWADSATLDTLGFLAEHVAHIPVLLIACYRNDDLSRGHQLRRLRSDLRRKGLLVEVAVVALDAESSARLLQALLPAKPSPALADDIFGRTEGLPFFVEEIAAAITDSGSLREGPLGLELDPEVALPLP